MYRADAEAHYKDVAGKAIQGIGVTRTNLHRILRSMDFVGWSSHEESGRLDRRALTRFASGSVNIFSRRMMTESETSAVSILIDCSGSMRGADGSEGRIDIAQQIAIHLSKLLQQARVPFAVTGFKSGGFDERIINNHHVYTESPAFIQFKQWGKSLQSSIAHMGFIHRSAGGGTPDYSAAVNALTDLHARPEARKILFLLTDADSYYTHHMQHVQKMADKMGITIVAIGIGNTDVQSCFINAINVRNLDELASTSFNQLLKAVERKRK